MKLKNRDIVNFINGCAVLRAKKLPFKSDMRLIVILLFFPKLQKRIIRPARRSSRNTSKKILKENQLFEMTVMYLKMNRRLIKISKNFSVLIQR